MHITSTKSLQETIIELEKRKIAQQQILVDKYHDTVESLKPSNLIRGAVGKVAHSASARSGILKTVVGVGLGILTKKMFIGKSTSLFQKLVSNAIKIGVAKTAISNTDRVKAYGTAIYNNVFKKKSGNKLTR